MNNLNDSNVLQNALIGVEFEFYSNFSAEETAKKLAKLLGKKIHVEDKAHSDFEVTQDEFKIEPDMSGGAKLLELVTGALPYFAARLMIINVSKWIQENGYTNDRSSIHLNLSFDKSKIENKYRISKMNVLKFILDFNEEQVFKFFPKRENSAYAKSIKFVLPKEDTYFFDGNYINQQNFIYPDTKYYGINFDKRHKNYLEFRYIGGADWEKKTTTILHLADQFLLQLWKSVISAILNPSNCSGTLSDSNVYDVFTTRLPSHIAYTARAQAKTAIIKSEIAPKKIKANFFKNFQLILKYFFPDKLIEFLGVKICI